MADEERTADLNIRGMSPELRQQFKVLCVQKNISMTDAVIMMIEGAVAEKIPIPFGTHTPAASS